MPSIVEWIARRCVCEREDSTVATHNATLKNAGYLLCLLPQGLLVLGTWLQFSWLSVLFFFVALPLLRYLIGNDFSPPVQVRSRWLAYYLDGVPRLYCLIWALVLPWVIWTLATQSMTCTTYLGFALSLWIVCSLNTAIAHELIHAPKAFDRTVGGLLDASIGYIHFAEEHLSHHVRTGHHRGGDAATPGVSIYRYAVGRYRNSMRTAWEVETGRLRRAGLPWHANRLLCKLPIPISIAMAFYVFAGGYGLAVYLFQVVGTAFTIQAITYLQHWGLTQRSTPQQADFGFAWEDGCWMQACVTLNHAYHGIHHLDPRRRYYQLAWRGDRLSLPGSYPVMFVVALFPPWFSRLMHNRLSAWLTDADQREAYGHRKNCISLSKIVSGRQGRSH